MTNAGRQPLPTNLPLTRRRLLQAFGALGGSSFVMGAMDAWGLMGAASGAGPLRPTRRRGYLAGERASPARRGGRMFA